MENIVNPSFEVIFVTAHDEFAIEAIKRNALDYILKPIDRSEFNEAVSQFLANKPKPLTRSFEKLLLEFSKKENQNRLRLPTQNGFKIIEIQNIVRCEADGNYTKFFFENEPPIIVSKTMKEYEDILSENSFVRIHHSHIVNVSL